MTIWRPRGFLCLRVTNAAKILNNGKEFDFEFVAFDSVYC